MSQTETTKTSFDTANGQYKIRHVCALLLACVFAVRGPLLARVQ